MLFLSPSSEDDAQKSKQIRIYEFESENARATKGINLSSLVPSLGSEKTDPERLRKCWE